MCVKRIGLFFTVCHPYICVHHFGSSSPAPPPCSSPAPPCSSPALPLLLPAPPLLLPCSSLAPPLLLPCSSPAPPCSSPAPPPLLLPPFPLSSSRSPAPHTRRLEPDCHPGQLDRAAETQRSDNPLQRLHGVPGDGRACPAAELQ